MNDIRCPHCSKTFKADDVFSHHIEEERKKFEQEKAQLRARAEEWKEAKEKELKEEMARNRKQQESELRKKVEQELEIKLKDTKNEAEELQSKNKRLQEEVLEMGKLMRQLKARQEEIELENQKKLAAAEEAIRDAAKKKAQEEAHFKILELEKRLLDVSKVNEDLKRKLEQGSQQMQGEVLELELEKMLAAEFPFDEIKPVPKGIRGADIMHIVKNAKGLSCGIILWELKRTKAWSAEWVRKLKDDQRSVHADCAVIISQVVPEGIQLFGEIDGVVVGEYNTIVGIAKILRQKLQEIAYVKNATDNTEDKKDILYNYITSTEFRHRMDAIAESFKMQQDLLESEKRWFAKKWASQEKAIRRMIDHTFGMRGELESIMGNQIEELTESAELPEHVEISISVQEEEPVKDTLF